MHYFAFGSRPCSPTPEARAKERASCFARADRHALTELQSVKANSLRTSGVNTNGAAASVMNLDRLGKKVHQAWHFWEDRSRLTGEHKNPLSKNMKFAVNPLVLTPCCPFPKHPQSHLQALWLWIAQSQALR